MITMSGTEKSGPPAPEKPEPKPENAPTEASSQRPPRERPVDFGGTKMYMPAAMITSAMMMASGRGSMSAATAAPANPNTTAAAQTGSEMRQSMLPRRW